MKKFSAKSRSVIDHFKNDPAANVAEAAKKFKMNVQYVYKLRQRSRTEGKAEKRAVQATWNAVKKEFTVTVPKESKNTISVDGILDARAVDYGAFKDGASLMQGIKRLMAEHAQRHNKTFADDQWEALEMIVHKMGRIVNGDPDKVDHWADIAGYAKLVADRLEGRVR
jgi:hypothetical protein